MEFIELLFLSTYTLVVAIAAAAVELYPAQAVPAPVRRFVGMLLVLACWPVALLSGHDVAQALRDALVGLGSSWLVVEIGLGLRRAQPKLPAREAVEPEIPDSPRLADARGGQTVGVLSDEEEEPPPIHPPPSVK